MSYFIDRNGNYYEGDRSSALDQEVPQRPSASHKWDGSAWQIDTRTQALDAIAALEQEQAQRLTARALRELYLSAFASGGMTTHPAYVALKAIETQIQVERQKL